MFGKKAAKPPAKPPKPAERLLDVDNDDDLAQYMPEGIDVHSILNDASLNQELLDLGWGSDDPVAVAPPKPVPAARQKAAPLSPPAPEELVMPAVTEEDLIDVSDIGVVDESAMVLSEEDMNDPELLSMYASLQGHPPPAAAPAAPVEPKALAPLVHQETTSSLVTTEEEQAEAAEGPGPANLSLDEVKQRALKYKREGNNAEALRWYRYVKQMEAARAPLSKPAAAKGAVSPMTPQPSTVNEAAAQPKKAPKPTPAPIDLPIKGPASSAATVQDDFSNLEAALEEASKSSLSAAKALRDAQPKVAIERMRDYKGYQQELVVLRSRRGLPGARPALFRWQVDRKETKLERLEIGETEIKLVITSLQNIDNALKDHNSKEVSVAVNLNIGSKDEPKAVISTPKVKYANNTADFNFEITLPVLKRTKLTQQAFARKKGTFEVILHKGNMFWSSTAVLATGTIPLSDLVSKSECTGPFPLFAAEEEGKSSKKGSTIGGSLLASVLVRSPLAGPQMVVTEERKLIVEAWPAVADSPMSATPPPAYLPHPAPVEPVAVVMPAPVASSTAPAAASGSLVLTDREINDPDSTEFLDSNDVLEAEIRNVEDSIRRGIDEEEAFTANLRLDMLRTKLQMLVYKVQNEELSMDQYLEMIKARIARDKVLALHFKAIGEPEATQQAVRIMRRIKIMNEEVKNAEEAV